MKKCKSEPKNKKDLKENSLAKISGLKLPRDLPEKNIFVEFCRDLHEMH